MAGGRAEAGWGGGSPVSSPEPGLGNYSPPPQAPLTQRPALTQRGPWAPGPGEGDREEALWWGKGSRPWGASVSPTGTSPMGAGWARALSQRDPACGLGGQWPRPWRWVRPSMMTPWVGGPGLCELGTPWTEPAWRRRGPPRPQGPELTEGELGCQPESPPLGRCPLPPPALQTGPRPPLLGRGQGCWGGGQPRFLSPWGGAGKLGQWPLSLALEAWQGEPHGGWGAGGDAESPCLAGPLAYQPYRPHWSGPLWLHTAQPATSELLRPNPAICPQPGLDLHHCGTEPLAQAKPASGPLHWLSSA